MNKRKILNNHGNSKYSVKDLKEIKSKLLDIKSSEKENRVIGIYADSHGLFEPTLAVLEDMRKNGITEIYSLGDNVGTGPNSSEVMDLLDMYGVSSLSGNHELYGLWGLDEFKEHFSIYSKDTFDRAKENSAYTFRSLTPSQIEQIRSFPLQKEILINGKKILLTHSIRDFNTDEILVNKEDYDLIFQGHVHFSSEEDNIKTIRAVGFGAIDSQTEDKASYVTVEISPDGSYEIKEHLVNFDRDSTYYDIIESDLSEYDKNKIKKWMGMDSSKSR